MSALTERLKHRKRYWVPPLVILALFFLVFYGLDPLVEWKTRESMKLFEPRYQVTFEDASLQPTKLNYVLKGLKITRQSAGGDQLPYVQIERVEGGVFWRELLHGHVVGRAEITAPRLNLIAAKQEEEQQLDPKIPDLAEKLEKLIPLKVDRIQVRDAAMLFTDKTNEELPQVWVHDVDLTVENLATRAALARGEPTTVAISGTLQESGALSVFLTADPLAKGLFFAGRASVTDFQLADLSKAMAAETGLKATEGTLDLYAEFDCRAGKVRGGVKPVLKNVEFEKGEPGVVNQLKEWLADAAVDLLTDEKDGRAAVATVVPIRGDLTNPDLQLWPAIVGVVRNAFVVGLTEGFGNVTLPDAEKKESVPEQIIEGLDKKKLPDAQPTN
ncbi:MAG TPA: DUF748 domain-containing protein [Archangium sp.]